VAERSGTSILFDCKLKAPPRRRFGVIYPDFACLLFADGEDAAARGSGARPSLGGRDAPVGGWTVGDFI